MTTWKKDWRNRCAVFMVVTTTTAVIAVACGSAVSNSPAPTINPGSSAETGPVPEVTSTVTLPGQPPDPVAAPQSSVTPPAQREEFIFDVEAFEKINPRPELRALDRSIDIGFDERETIPPDSINPVYEPKFVDPGEVSLLDDELVMGLEINGEARAYPVGFMRIRELVNDNVGGVPVLVTWCPVCLTGIVHDRRLEGETLVFGNQSALFMSAMTWWDHKTKSIWSQPWGAAIEGEMLGTQLTLVPFDLVPWKTWSDRHPNTKVIVDERANLTYAPQLAHDTFVIGVSIGEAATAYYFRSVANKGVVNDSVGDVPVAVFADGEDRGIEVFIRRALGEKARKAEAPDELTFEITGDGAVIDIETGTEWDIERGVGTNGPLRGAILQRAPYISSLDWAWEDFFPNTDFWGSAEDARIKPRIISKLDLARAATAQAASGAE